ncbi:hypothetical protein ASD58_29040 [Duganella sp. Root1480D1]|nr:hypothetical protein ASD58_29040 [Duganella sp. Root1480D1]
MEIHGLFYIWHISKKETMNYTLPALLLSLLSSTALAAGVPAVTVKQIGATFMEAPPGREKNLVPFATLGAQESVETHAVIIFQDRLIADIPAFGNDDSKITASAIVPNKPQVSLGTVKASSFRKVSEDGKKTLVSLSISRLPDGGVRGVSFNGYLKLPVATSIARTSVAFQPKVGAKIDVGLGNSVISNIDSTSITLSGDERLMGIAAMKILKADGSTIIAERGGYSRENRTDGTAVSAQWRFSGPISAGKLEVSSYRDLTTVEVPINLIVAKPY